MSEGWVMKALERNRAELEEERTRESRLRERVADLEATFDLRHRADMRAIERWRGGHPERALTLPDQADLCVWLLERLEESSAQLAEATAQLVAQRETFERAYRIIALLDGDVSSPIDFNEYGREIREALANPNPLVAAVGRVVEASIKRRDSSMDDEEACQAETDAVDSLRALAPWYPS